MKKSIGFLAVLPVLAAIAAPGLAVAQQAGAPAVRSEMSSISATVQAVYPEKRSVTLVGQDGKPQTIFVGPDVKLERIKAGDKVTVSYYQGVAAQIAKGGKKVSDPAASTFAYKDPQGRPGGGLGASVTVTVKILGVDPGTSTVRFENPDGTDHVIAVKSDQMKAFVKTLKVGDVVDVTYTESVAITVAPAT